MGESNQIFDFIVKEILIQNNHRNVAFLIDKKLRSTTQNMFEINCIVVRGEALKTIKIRDMNNILED